jgi:hypothetical protein
MFKVAIKAGAKVTPNGLEILDKEFRLWTDIGIQEGFKEGIPIAKGFIKSKKNYDPLSRLSMICASLLMDNYDKKVIEGISLGSFGGCLLTDMHYLETAIPEAGKNASPNLFRCVVPSIPIGEICIAFGIKGANTFITAGEVSGLTAIVQGAEWIAHGILSNCMVGGMDIDCVEIREMLCSEKKNSFNSTAYFFILERAEQMYGHYLTNFDTFFQKNHFVKSHEPLIPFLGNLGMEELWQALKVPGKKKLSFVSFDGHEVELDLFNEETE